MTEHAINDKIDELTEDGYSFKTTDYIGNAFTLINKYAGVFIGFTFVFFITSMTLNAAESALLPNLSLNVLSSLLSAVWLPGMYIAARHVQQNKPLEFSHFFKGHQSAGPLIAVYLLVRIVTTLPFVPGIVSLFLNDSILEQIGYFIEAAQDGELEIPVIGLLSTLLLLGGFLISIYLSISYMFAVPLVLFGKMGIFQAMEGSRRVIGKRFFNAFGLAFLAGLLIILGIILLLIGLLYFMPVAMVATYIAFADIFELDADRDEDDEWIEHLIEE